MPVITNSPFSIPGFTFGNDSFTKLLIHSDTTDGSTTAVDSSVGGVNSPHSVSMINGAQHNTNHSLS